MSYGYSCNDNQNYFVEEGRTTSRVLQNPGGKSSISLGWDVPVKVSSKQEESDELKQKPAEVSNHAVESNTRDEKNDAHTNISNNAFASGSRMNSGNVITDRPSSRVLNPPGGKSSIFLG